MKKVALLSLSLMLGIAGFAQRPRPTRNASAFKQSVTTQVKAAVTGDEEAPMSFTPTNYIPRVATSNRFGEDYTWEEFYTMTTYYDLQSNSAIGNRLTVWDDGTAAIVETWDHNNATWAKRGTGYNHYNGSEFGEEPSERLARNIMPVERDKPGLLMTLQVAKSLAHNLAGVAERVVLKARQRLGEAREEPPVGHGDDGDVFGNAQTRGRERPQTAAGDEVIGEEDEVRQRTHPLGQTLRQGRIGRLGDDVQPIRRQGQRNLEILDGYRPTAELLRQV